MKRKIRFGLLLSLDEKRALVKLAGYEGGLSKGAWIRNLIRREARERGLWPPSITSDVSQTQGEKQNQGVDDDQIPC